MALLERLWNAFSQRRGFDPSPGRALRPNELSREAVSAERRRREASRSTVSATQAQRSPEEQRPRREPVTAAPRGPTGGKPGLVAGLKSRSGLRQAMLLKEILEPPLALRGQRVRDTDRD